MSELMTNRIEHQDCRRSLLATVSAFAVLTGICSTRCAVADEGSGAPTVWIELGGQLDRVDAGEKTFIPPFFDTITANGFGSPLNVDRLAQYSNGVEGTISFAPSGSDWVVSASARYGRSVSQKYLHQQEDALTTVFAIGNSHQYFTAAPAYEEVRSRNSGSHLIVDFRAGKEIGVGLFGGGTHAIVSVGVRFAQFDGSRSATIRARTDSQIALVPIIPGVNLPFSGFHEYFASSQRSSSFKGLGPSLTWNASTPLLGNSRDGEVSLDWGVNAAALFGRQKLKGHQISSGYVQYGRKYSRIAQIPGHSGLDDRSHSVVVPNLGAVAGLSLNYEQAKVSFGYRADFFFGATDGGLDTRKSGTVDFYGPFASVSVGIGG